MQIIRDNEDKAGIFILPLLKQYGVSRCNFMKCEKKPNTIGLSEKVNLGLCENHYQELKSRQGEENLQVEFFFNDDPKIDAIKLKQI